MPSSSSQENHCSVCNRGESFPNCEQLLIHVQQHQAQVNYTISSMLTALHQTSQLQDQLLAKFNQSDEFWCSVSNCRESFPDPEQLWIHVQHHQALLNLTIARIFITLRQSSQFGSKTSASNSINRSTERNNSIPTESSLSTFASRIHYDNQTPIPIVATKSYPRQLYTPSTSGLDSSSVSQNSIYSSSISSINYDQTPMSMDTNTYSKRLFTDTSGYLDSNSTENLSFVKKVKKNDQNHACDEPNCDKRYTRANDLARHKQKVHKIEKPYKCFTCNFRSLNSNQLKQHLKSCTGEGGCGDEKSLPSEQEIDEKKSSNENDESEINDEKNYEIKDGIDY